MKRFFRFITVFTLLSLQLSCDDAEKKTTPTSCDGVDCSGRGLCVVDGGGEPLCACFEGYTAQGLACLSVDDPCLDVTCSGHGTCVVAQGQPISCACDDGYIAQGLECTPETGAPIFQSVPTTDATAGVEYTYEVTCALEDASLVLSVNEADTCGGALVDHGDGTGGYSFTPPTAEDDDTCVLSIACTAGELSTTQEESLTIHGVAAENWDQVSGGHLFSCGLRGGRLYCWGVNHLGQLGQGHQSGAYSPARVGLEEDWTFVEAGYSHACGIRGGRLYCWGDNAFGQLGDGTTELRSAPVQVGMSSDWTRVTAGGSHSCGIRNQAAYCWGYNHYGQLGDTTTTDRATPTSVGTLTGLTDISAGDAHSCAIANQELYCWGYASDGQIGQTTNSPTPLRVGSETGWLRISLGAYHSCGILQGALFCWGWNEDAQLGNGTTTNTSSPARVGQATDWTDISLGTYHTCGVQGGGMYCWGQNYNNQLGDGTIETRATPTAVGSDTDWQAVGVSSFGSCGLRPGELSCWGIDVKGLAGRKMTANRWSTHYCIVTTDDRLFCWGGNGDGQLGLGDTGAHPYLNAVPDLDGVTLDAAAEGASTCAVKTDGTVWCWGDNSYGQLGDGASLDSSVPQAVSGLADIVQIAMGERHVCALEADGTLWCWGFNDAGQLGDGSLTTRRTPVSVATGVTQVSCGGKHTCVVKTDGNAWCWGDNAFGQLGDGSYVDSATAVQVTGIDTPPVVHVSAGNQHSCALRSEGYSYCWGNNDEGQLGVNSLTATFNTARSTWAPGQILAISAGADRSSLVKSSGRMQWAGADQYPYFVDVPNMTTGFVLTEAGNGRILAMKGTGDVYCYGSNCYESEFMPDGYFYYDGPYAQFSQNVAPFSVLINP